MFQPAGDLSKKRCYSREDSSSDSELPANSANDANDANGKNRFENAVTAAQADLPAIAHDISVINGIRGQFRDAAVS